MHEVGAFPPLLEEVKVVAIRQAYSAISEDTDALHRLAYYYDPRGNYSGTSFLDAAPNPPSDIVAADLYAVTRLSMTIRNDQSRLILSEGPERDTAISLLRAIPDNASILELSPSLLQSMWDFYDHFRCLLATGVKDSNHWVFAAKLCARKRPKLFPVRDGKVCQYLSGDTRPKSKANRIGQFGNDIQVFKYLMGDESFVAIMSRLQRICGERRIAVDQSQLRFLDVLLWTKAMQY